MKILVIFKFLNQIWLQKTVFCTNIEKTNVFFNPIFKYLTIYLKKKLLLTPCAFCFIQNQEMVEKAFFEHVKKKKKNI